MAQRPDPMTETLWRRYIWWDVMYLVVSVLTAVLSAISADTAARRVWIVVLVAAIFGCYLLVGRRLATRQPVALWRELAFQGLMIALYLALATVAEGAPLMMMMLGSLAFWLGTTLSAVVVTLLLNGCTILGWYLGGRDPLDMIPLSLAIAAITLVSGSWSRSMVRQNLQRADLIHELRATQQEVARLSREAGVAAERQRVAADIHDTLAQGFGSIVMLAQALRASLERDPDAVHRHLDLIEETARDNLAEARAIVSAMQPPVLDGGLEDAVRRLAGDARVAVTGVPRPLPPPVAVVLLRSGQEALTNVRKHAGPASVHIELSFLEETVRLAVTDDGPGFDPAAATGGFGLSGMRGRATEVGGKMTVRSRPGEGTAVTVEVPA
ncbi:two-component sensor histidine kinase [Actinorhabdospora filicis]|uniref:Oxygen sensor histidine kinase NreB n=2 Tax=Actinorhabdospora filicis TaxID=1785913 RepID=A0A9W6WA35_9ACTN|nr:two-component sensor histidine kinase [Actinorhabdospora filicis]